MNKVSTVLTDLATLVPLNALTLDHLEALMRNHEEEFICAGQKLFNRGERDRRHLYLLSGVVRAETQEGVRLINAADPENRFPLLHHQPREATVYCESDCRVIRFDSDALDSMLAWDQASHYIMLDIASRREMDEDADWMLTLLRSNLFYKVPPMNIRAILDRFQPQVVFAGETIIRQGEAGDCCYFIKEGLAGVYQSPDGVRAPQLVNMLSAGRCFGDDALVNHAPRNASIVMHDNGVLMKLSRNDFYLLLKVVPQKTIGIDALLAASPGQYELLDVRTQDEYEQGHLRDARLMPLDLLKLKLRMLDRESQYVSYCNTGRRSGAAAQLLKEEGINCVALSPGIERFSSEQLGQLGYQFRVAGQAPFNRAAYGVASHRG